MKKSLMVSLIVGLIIASAESIPIHGLQLETWNGSKCAQRNPMQLTFFNGASASDSYQVPLAAEAWSDAPVLIHLSSASSQSSATIIAANTNDPRNQWLGITFTVGNPSKYLTCSNGYVDGPVEVEINDYYVSQYESNSTRIFGFQVSDNDYRIHLFSHEMGHSIGLDHSQVICSVMWEGPESISGCGRGVYFPVVDDIKAAAMLYGWAGDTGFASDSFSGTTTLTGFPYPPLDLQINTPSSGAAVKVYNTTALPFSNIAIMTAYVTPSTLYRFHFGWQTSVTTFSSLELDNDGAKLAYDEGSNIVNVQNVNSSFTPQIGASYFLELIVEKLQGGLLKTHAYVYRGSIASSNSAEYFDGHFGDVMLFCNVVCSYAANWADAASFEAAVWTDSSSNPASHYSLDHFWNFQSSAAKTLPASPGIDSLVVPNRWTYGVGGSLTFSAHAYPLSRAVIQWGDGQPDTTVSFSDYAVVSGPITVYHSYLVDFCGFLVGEVTVYDVLGQSAYQYWAPCVQDFSVGASPTSLSIPQGSSRTSSMSVASVNQFAGTVSLSGASATSGITASFSPPSFFLAAGSSSSPTVSIMVASSARGGTYSLIATATSSDSNGNQFSHQVIFTVVVPGFTMSTSPSTVTLVCTYSSCDQQSATSTLTVTSVNGFSGTIALSYIAPSPTGYTLVSGPSSVFLSAGGTATVTVTAYLGSISGVYVWTLQGQSQGFSTTTTLTIDEYICNTPHHTPPCPTTPIGQPTVMATDGIPVV